MRKKYLILGPLVCLFPSFSLFAQELRLPEEPAAVRVPAVTAAAADVNQLKADYLEIYSALEVYSEAAYVSAQSSPEYIEASAYGQYLRVRLENIAALIKRETGEDYELPAGDVRGVNAVSLKVLSELIDVFSFNGVLGVREAESRGVVIKQGYCQVNYVKGNVPYLVQQDGFLKKGEVILTFDDGPGPLTEEVSAAMKEAGAPSVFFVLGSKLGETGKARVKKMTDDGHEAAVHGYNHATEAGKPFTALSTSETLRQLAGVAESIKTAAGKKAAFFRPPYGVISPEALKAITSDLELTPVGWTIDTLDWSTKDPEQLYQNTIAMIKERGKGIVLLHDIHPQSRTAAKRLVVWLAANGYTVVSPDRMTKAFRGE